MNRDFKFCRSEKLDEKDLELNKDSPENETCIGSTWSEVVEDDNISDSQSKVVTETVEEEEEYEITEFDD